MTSAEKIVATLLEEEGEEKPKKNMPDWLKRIKGIKDDDDGGTSDEPSKSGEKKSGGSFKSGETPGKTW